MTYSIDPTIDLSMARPQDCTRGGGRNVHGLHMIDIIERVAYSRADTDGFRVLDDFGLDNLAAALQIKRQSARQEFVQMVRRKTIEATRLKNSDYRFCVVR